MNLEITAVIVTHNRAEQLPSAIRSLVRQDLDPGRYQILVVDNASTDDTRQVIRDAFSEVPNLRVLHEPRLGVSHARNAGWRSAHTRYVAYLDDDAVAAPDWLARILEIFSASAKQPGCLGGRVDPIWETPRPRWLPDALLPFLTVLDLSEAPTEMPSGRYLYGTNAAFPRARLEEIGGYRPDLGPIGRWHRSGEDTFVQKQLRAAGHALLYDPSLVVHHRVHPERLEKRWLLRRMYWEGLSRGRQELHERQPGPRERIGMVRRALRRLLRSPRRLIAVVLPSRGSPTRFERKAAVYRRAGTLAALLGRGGRID